VTQAVRAAPAASMPAANRRAHRASAQLPPEAFVSWVWEGRHLNRSLTTADGRRLEVIFPGRRGGSWGPDFRGALLLIDGRIERGDVEVHVRASGWHLHGHGTNPDYNSTVLHVVYCDEAALPAVRQDGRVLPQIALQPFLAASVEALLEIWGSQPCVEAFPACLSPEEAHRVLGRGGLLRFWGKAARFEGDLSCVDPAQALWAGMLEALGYSQNVAPAREIARRITLASARERLAFGRVEVEALLLGEAGLLPCQRGRPPMDDWTAAVEAAWLREGASASWSGPVGWRWLGVRPSNTPARRVAAAAALLAEPPGFDSSRVTDVLRADDERGKPAKLRRLAERAGGDYWRSHADLGRELRHPAALIGAERAADIVVNVYLPWAAAMGRFTGDEQLADSAVAIYQAHPPLAPNQITRHMARQILGADARRVLRTACLQQGLIHIYQGWCDERICQRCPAGPGVLAFGGA